MLEKLHRNTKALVIGGTQGLGFAVAEALLREGCTNVVISGRDDVKGLKAAKELGATYLTAELADTDAIVGLVDKAIERLGSVNAMVIAGALTDRGSIIDTDRATYDRIMTANTRSPFFAIQRMANHAIAKGHSAAIVNILSMSAHCGQSFLAPYSASKAALANITKNAAQALRARKIRVNGINCGWMNTPGEDATQRKYHGAGDDWLAEAEARQPFGTLVDPAHVAWLVSYMLSSASGVMTGSIVDFDQYVAGAYPE